MPLHAFMSVQYRCTAIRRWVQSWFVPAMLAGSALHWAFNAPKQAKVDH
ncbi:hypothetical protein XCR_3059 [Xanthomonas campestris pv. raphani 756C]|nr:hypothetical protein XCR_3059 [Xanthomonas campestris pv. raphani 756C]